MSRLSIRAGGLRTKGRPFRTVLLSLLTALAALAATAPALAAGQYGGDIEALVAELPQARHSLAEGIRQVTRGGEVAIVAKFEHEHGHLYLSVYTCEKGLGMDAEHNVFKEYKGSPKSEEWQPEIEVFDDFTHIARSAQYHTLMSISPYSLRDIIEKAKRDERGPVVWVRSIVENGKPVFDVAVLRGGALMTLRYDLLRGTRLQ